MRRSTLVRIATATVAALGLGGLAACSGGDAPDPAATTSATATTDVAADEAALASVEVVGEPGAKPSLTLPTTPFTVSNQVARVIDEGTGAEVGDGNVAHLHILEVLGTDGSERGSTWDEGATQPTAVSSETLFPGLYEALASAKVGTRILIAAPTSSGTILDVLEVDGVLPVPATRAEGTSVEPADGLPTVTLDDTGKPALTAADGDAPAELVVQPLIEGAGPEVEAGQTVVVKYTGWLWDGTQFDSSWDTGTVFPVGDIGQGGVIAGWNQGLVGLTVGSQALLVIPPDLGYGSAGSGPIPGDATLVFVVDVLAAE